MRNFKAKCTLCAERIVNEDWRGMNDWRIFTDNVVKDMLRILFWGLVILGNIQFWTGFSIAEWIVNNC